MIPVLILAGGAGTRLRNVIGDDTPKPMANISDKPFLWWLISYLEKQGVREVYLSVGYKKEKIIDFFGSKYKSVIIKYINEEEPLGTGGAIKVAADLIGEDFIVINGDTFSLVNLESLIELSMQTQADLSIALTKCLPETRYGKVKLDSQGNVTSFIEKSENQSDLGCINAGVYFVSHKIKDHFPKEKKFSFEKDFLEINLKELNIRGLCIVEDFIDIGVPEDYFKCLDFFNRKK